jgi:hypothetical protein
MNCTLDTCDNPQFRRGYCVLHFTRWKRHGHPMLGGTSPGVPRRFIEETAAYSGDECIVWPYAKLPTGYGRVNGDYAHRIVCTQVHGPSPSPTHQAAHSCGNGHLGCITPNHLRWATPKENQADRRIHGTIKSGTENPVAKLTEEDVIQIREMAKTGKYRRQIAEKYGVSRQSIDNVVNRKTYQEVNQ